MQHSSYIHVSLSTLKAYCVHIHVNPENGTRRFDGTEHVPAIRGCYDDKDTMVATAAAEVREAAVTAVDKSHHTATSYHPSVEDGGGGGGNPVGTGFQFTAAGGGAIKSWSCT